MSRLDTQYAQEVAADVHRLIWLLRIDFSGGTWAAGSGDKTYTVDAVQYLPGVGLLSIGGITEDGEINADPIKIELAGTDPDLRADLLAMDSHWAAINFGFALLDAGHDIIETPYWFPEIYIDQPESRVGDSNVIVVSGVSDVADLVRPANVRFSPADQKARYSGDKFFDLTHTLRNKNVVINGNPQYSPGEDATAGRIRNQER